MKILVDLCDKLQTHAIKAIVESYNDYKMIPLKFHRRKNLEFFARILRLNNVVGLEDDETDE